MSEDAKAEKPSEAPETEAEEAEETEAGGAEGEAEQDAPTGLKAKLAGKLKYILIGVGVLVLIGSGAGVYFSGILHTEKLHQTTIALPGPPVFHEIPRITVDLKPSPGRARPFIRLTMQAELQGDSAKEAFITYEVKIMDALQAHLRTVTAPELSGQQGTERLREDFIIIINRIIAPEVAISVFYKDILVR
mgnify:CR=1 FL=1